MKKISVIVPVYGVEKYLNKCVESIVNQTYQNIEIILIDDGSPDKCPQICDEWAQKDNRIIVIHKSNSGVSESRNMGLERASGDYIGFIDSDDYIDPEMYEKLINAIQKNDSDIALCGIYKEDENGSKQYICEENLKNVNVDDLFKYYILNNFYIKNDVFYTDNVMASACRCLYKKNVINKTQFVQNGLCEDFIFNIEILTPETKFAIVDEYLYCYFQRSDSVLHVFNEQKLKKQIRYVHDMLNANIKIKIEKELINAWKFLQYRNILLNISRCDDTKILKKYKELNELKLNTKVNYKEYQKLTTSKVNKIVNYLVHKNKIKILKFLFKIKK